MGAASDESNSGADVNGSTTQIRPSVSAPDVVSQYIEETFKDVVCDTFVSSGDSCMGCKRIRADHTNVENDPNATWDPQIHTKKQKANVFGMVRFEQSGATVNVANFVRVANDTPAHDIAELLMSKWNMYQPGLLISVTGGAMDFHLPSSLRRTFSLGLMKTASAARAWLTTGGTDAGVMRLVGQARSEFSQTIPLLGICTWGILDGRDWLESVSAPNQPSGSFSYNYEMSCSTAAAARLPLYEKHNPKSPGLDKHHSAFIMVNDGSVGQFGREIDLRAKIESAVRNKTNWDHPVPMVCVVVQGGRGTIHTIYSAINAGSPVVLVQGTGGAADFVGNVFRHLHEDESFHEDGVCPCLVDPSAHCSELANLFQDTFPNLGDSIMRDNLRMVVQVVRTPERVCVYDTSRDDSLSEVVLKAILGGMRIQPGVSKWRADFPADDPRAWGHLNLQQKLQLTIAWNMPTVGGQTLQDFFGKKGSGGDLSPEVSQVLSSALTYALVKDGVEFVEYLLSYGASLRSETFDFLFSNEFLTNPANDVLHLFVMLRDVTEIGEGHWLRNFFSSVFEKLTLRHKARVHCSSKIINFSHKVDSLVRELLDAPYKVQFGTPHDQDDHHVYYDAMIWAVLCNRPDMAELFWQRVKFPIRSAVVACCLFRKMETERSTPPELRSSLRVNALRFERLATDLVDFCYKENQKLTLQALELPWAYWDLESPMDLAVHANCELLVAVESFERAVISRWTGDISVNQLSDNDYVMWVVMSALMLPLAMFLRYDDGVPVGRVKDDAVAAIDIQVSKLSRFFDATVTKFVLHALSYFAFLVFFTGVCLIDFDYEISLFEWIVGIWTLALCLEEIIELASTGWRAYVADMWNFFDTGMLILFGCYCLTRYIGDPSLAKYFINTSAVFFYLRVLQFMSVNRKIGPLIISMQKMMGDIMSFMFVIVLFILGFGIAIQGVMDQYTGAYDFPIRRWTDALEGVALRPYWGMYGEIFAEDVQALRGAYAYILMAIYLVISNVLLLNLLIAVMSSTYAAVEELAHVKWLFLSYHLTKEFERKPRYSFPPFTIFWRLALFAQDMMKKFGRTRGKKIQHIREEAHMTRVRSRIVPNYAFLPKASAEAAYIMAVQSVSDFVDQCRVKLLEKSRLEHEKSVDNMLDDNRNNVLDVLDSIRRNDRLTNERFSKMERALEQSREEVAEKVQEIADVLFTVTTRIDNLLSAPPTARASNKEPDDILSALPTSGAGSTSASTEVSFVTDVEGNLDYFNRYVLRSSVLYYDVGRDGELRLRLRHNKYFVFGGDAVDKGPGDIRFVKLLINLKKEYPDRVFFIGGNRDYNKMRMTSELNAKEVSRGFQYCTYLQGPYWVKQEDRVSYETFIGASVDDDGNIVSREPDNLENRLKYMLIETMGCPNTFHFRRQELAVLKGVNVDNITDDEVTDSYLDSLRPSGFMHDYLMLTQIAVVLGDTLFIHGALNQQNYGIVPGRVGRSETVQEWVDQVNEWARRQLDDWENHPFWEDGDAAVTGGAGQNTRPPDGRWRGGDGLMDYVVNNGASGGSTIYASYMENNMPVLPDEEVLAWLRKSGIRFVLSGHRPHGDSPLPICTDDVAFLMADTSYSDPTSQDNRGNALSEVIITLGRPRGRRISRSPSAATLGANSRRNDGGTVTVVAINKNMIEIEYKLGDSFPDPYIGRPTSDGRWVKGKLKERSSDGEDAYLVCHAKGREIVTEFLSLPRIRSLMPAPPSPIRLPPTAEESVKATPPTPVPVLPQRSPSPSPAAAPQAPKPVSPTPPGGTPSSTATGAAVAPGLADEPSSSSSTQAASGADGSQGASGSGSGSGSGGNSTEPTAGAAETST
eukprot:Rmarinus@m.29660